MALGAITTACRSISGAESAVFPRDLGRKTPSRIVASSSSNSSLGLQRLVQDNSAVESRCSPCFSTLPSEFSEFDSFVIRLGCVAGVIFCYLAC